MNIFFWCKSHQLAWKRIYDLCEVNPDTGEVSYHFPISYLLTAFQTALQVFNKIYKQATPDNGHSLLRKAGYLEAIINAAHRDKEGANPPVPKVKVAPKCRTCKTEYSPFFHYNDQTRPNEPECHRCCFARVKAKKDEGEDVEKANAEYGWNRHVEEKIDTKYMLASKDAQAERQCTSQ